MNLTRLESHQYGDNTINILLNEDINKYFVLDKNGLFNASEYFFTIKECYEYIKSTYGLKLKVSKWLRKK